MKSLSGLVVLMYFLACQQPPTGGTPDENSPELSTEFSEPPTTDSATAFHEPKFVTELPAIDTLYVINPEGADFYKWPELQLKYRVSDISPGKKVEVVEYLDEDGWMAVRLTEQLVSKENGATQVVWGWKKYFVKAEDCGPDEPVQWTQPELYGTFDDQQIQEQLDINFVDWQLFDSLKFKDTGQYVLDRALVSTQDSLGFSVQLGNGKQRTFEHKGLSGDEYGEQFYYSGHIQGVNAFLVSVAYYESGAWFMYDAHDGTELTEMVDRPYFSPDRTKMLCIYANPYETTSDFQWYELRDGKFLLEISAQFTGWMLYDSGPAITWKNNDEVVLKVLESDVYWDDEGRSIEGHEFIRIKRK